MGSRRMARFQKHGAVILAVCLALCLAAPTAAAAPDMDRLNELCGTDFDAAQPLTREEFFVCVAKVFGAGDGSGVDLPYEDLEEIKPESIPYIAVLYQAGIVTGGGSDGKLLMKPDEVISRQEAITLLGRIIGTTSDFALPFTDADSVAGWALGYVAWFAEREIVTGDNNRLLRPKDKMSAAGLAYLFTKTLAYKQASLFAGTGNRGFADGAAASFTLPYGLTADKDGGIVVFDTYNNAVRVIAGGKTTTLAGRYLADDENRFSKGYYRDGDLRDALFNRPTGGVFNADGDLLVCDSENHVIRLIRDGKAYTFSGTEQGYADGSGGAEKFDTPMAVAIDRDGNLYVADTLNNCIRKVDAKGGVTTVAGTPQKAGFADGGAASALFLEPSGIAVSEDGGVIYVADTGNHRIRKIEDGQVTTLAGVTGEKDEDGYPFGGYQDGDAAAAMFNLPAGLTLAGDILIVADSGNSAIRAVTPSGQVVTVTGSPDDESIAGLDHPMGVLYRNGVLYIADTSNHQIKTLPFAAGAYK